MSDPVFDVNAIFNQAQADQALPDDVAQSLVVVDPSGQRLIDQMNGGFSVDDVSVAEAVFLYIILDNSGSIADSGLTQDVVDSYNQLLTEVRRTKQQDNIQVCLVTIDGVTVTPMAKLGDAPALRAGPPPIGNYNPGGLTPLYDTVHQVLTAAAATRLQFENDGVASRSIIVLLTDGFDQGSRRYHQPEELAPIIQWMQGGKSGDAPAQPLSMLFALGVGVDDRAFRSIFHRMGVEDRFILTRRTDGHELRQAMNFVSASVSQASQTAGNFSNIYGQGINQNNVV